MKILKILGLLFLMLCLCVCCLVACDDTADNDGTTADSGNSDSVDEEQEDGKKKTIEGVTLSDATFTYDGTAKSLEVAGTVPEGVSVSYNNNGKTDAVTAYVPASVFPLLL